MKWAEIFMQSIQSFGHKFMSALPNLIGALMILLIGWLLARFIAKVISKLLGVLKFDELSEKVKFTDMLSQANVKTTPSKLVGKFAYGLFMLIVIISASDAMGWNAVSEEISKLISFLPNVFVAIVIFVIGMYIASFIREIIKGTTSSMGISTGKLIGNVVFYIICVIVSLTALQQAGVDTSIITSNLLMIMGAVLLAAAVSYGIASKDLLSNILASFFSRRTFNVGQTIQIDDVRGIIVEVNNISVTVKNEMNEKIVIPAHQLITNRIKIIE